MRQQIILAVVREIRCVVTRFRRQGEHAGAIEFDGIKLLLSRIVFVGVEEHATGIGVHAVDGRYFVVSTFKLALQLGVGGERIAAIEAVEIHVRVAVAPAGPKEAVVVGPGGFEPGGLEHAKIVVHIHPRIGLRLGEYFAGFS